MSLPRKQDVIAAAISIVSQKIERIKAELDDLNDGNAQNSKSTAGDKHDTERAMVHLEYAIRNDLEQIKADSVNSVISNGSLVETSRGVFLIGAACGNVSLGSTSVFCISAHSPLAIELNSKSVGDVAEVNGNDFLIKSIQ
jgi:transcription elongation GreA/GreB family factor